MCEGFEGLEDLSWRWAREALLLLRTTQPLDLLLNDNSWHDGEGDDDDDDDSYHNNRGVALLLNDNSCHLFLGVTTCPGASHKSWSGWPQACSPQALSPIQQQVWVLVVKEIITTWCGVCTTYGKVFCVFWYSTTARERETKKRNKILYCFIKNSKCWIRLGQG